MKTICIALATVLCALQVSVALPRPDYGISVNVFSADKTDAVAASAILFLTNSWNTDPVVLSSDYQVLTDVLNELDAIGDEFHQGATDLFQAISSLATSDDDVAGSFGGVEAAVTAILTFNAGLSDRYDPINTALPNSDIVTMLQDAFGDVAGAADELLVVFGELQSMVEDALAEAAGGAITQTILRKHVNTSVTLSATILVQILKSHIPLVFYVLETVKEHLKLADDYIILAGNVAGEAVDYSEEGIEVLVSELDSYSDATSEIMDVVEEASIPNLDFDDLDLTLIPDIANEVNMFAEVYGADLANAIAAIQTHYADYQMALPDVLGDISDFYSNEACDHIYTIVTVLINSGPYAEYCYHKFGSQALSLIEWNARAINQCVDKEITRLLKLQEVLLNIAQMLVFSVENLLEQVTLCVGLPDQCNASDLALYYSELHTALTTSHLPILQQVVDHETDAGLNRLQVCIAVSKYKLLGQIGHINSKIEQCETVGPHD